MTVELTKEEIKIALESLYDTLEHLYQFSGISIEARRDKVEQVRKKLQQTLVDQK